MIQYNHRLKETALGQKRGKTAFRLQKNDKNFLKITLDKYPDLCYTIIRKRKGNKKNVHCYRLQDLGRI